MEDEDKVTVTLGDEIKISGVRVQHQGRRRFLLLSKILETLHSQYGWKDLRATNAVKPWKDNEAITFAVYLLQRTGSHGSPVVPKQILIYRFR